MNCSNLMRLNPLDLQRYIRVVVSSKVLLMKPACHLRSFTTSVNGGSGPRSTMLTLEVFPILASLDFSCEIKLTKFIF